MPAYSCPQDENSGAVYYLGRVELNIDQLDLADAPALYPGMQAEVIIITGDNRPIDYLLRPLTQSFHRAMRDR